MKILHLISNHKFTGPVDPALFLAQSLDRRPDMTVMTGVGRPPAFMKEDRVREVARERGLTLVEGLALRKHRRIFRDGREVRRLQDVIQTVAPDVIHTHVGNDLRLAVKAVRNSDLPIVHSLYGTSLKELSLDRRRLVRRKASGVVVHSGTLDQALRKRGVRTCLVPPVLELQRFDPARPLSLSKPFSLPEGKLAIGIVARMQRHRRFDVLLQAFREAVDQEPGLVLVIVGRGTWTEEVAKAPVRKLGLEDHVFFPGYVMDDDYVALLKAFAFLIFLVPGTDGTCRALREGMAMGLPIVGSRLGMIPELVGHLQEGWIVPDLAGGLAQAMVSLARDRALREKLGAAARRKALGFDGEAVASTVSAFYRQVMGS